MATATNTAASATAAAAAAADPVAAASSHRQSLEAASTANEAMWAHFEHSPSPPPLIARDALLSTLQTVLQDLNPAVYSIPFMPTVLVHLIADYAVPVLPLHQLAVVWADVSDNSGSHGTMEGLADLFTQVDERLYRDEAYQAKGLFVDLLYLSSKVDAPTLLQLSEADYAALPEETRITLLLRALTNARAGRAAGRPVDADLLSLLSAADAVAYDDDSTGALVRRVLCVSDERAELFLAGPAEMLAQWKWSMDNDGDRMMMVVVSFVDETTGALRLMPFDKYETECRRVRRGKGDDKSSVDAAKLQRARDFPPPFGPFDSVAERVWHRL
jgi:hypothetical protein